MFPRLFPLLGFLCLSAQAAGRLPASETRGQLLAGCRAGDVQRCEEFCRSHAGGDGMACADELASLALEGQNCLAGLTEFADEAALRAFFRGVDGHPPFQLRREDGYCAERAVMLIEELRATGKAARLIVFYAPADGALVPLDHDGQPASFGAHWAVEVRAGGVAYVLDPQFADAPLRLESYVPLFRAGGRIVELPGFYARPTPARGQLAAGEVGVRRLHPHAWVLESFTRKAPSSELYRGLPTCPESHQRNLDLARRALRGRP